MFRRLLIPLLTVAFFAIPAFAPATMKGLLSSAAAQSATDKSKQTGPKKPAGTALGSEDGTMTSYRNKSPNTGPKNPAGTTEARVKGHPCRQGTSGCP
jgi:hypothetical protein